MDCPLIEKCVFFNDRMANMPGIADMLKRDFCKNKYEDCARYKVKQATGVSHETLWPNNHENIDDIIAEIKAKQV